MARTTLYIWNDAKTNVDAYTYWMPDNGGYVRAETDGKSGTLADQVCWPKRRPSGTGRETVSAQAGNLDTVVRMWVRRAGVNAAFWFAVIKYDPNSIEPGELVSKHRTVEAAERALAKLGNVRGNYVAPMRPDGTWQRYLDTRDDIERGVYS